jgi:hypothetical protein
MDTNEISCPKCGHLNNYISEGCVKCGIIFSKYLEIQARQEGAAHADTAIGAEHNNSEPDPETGSPDEPESAKIEMDSDPDRSQAETLATPEARDNTINADSIPVDNLSEQTPQFSMAENDAPDENEADSAEKEILLNAEAPDSPQPASSIFSVLDKQAESPAETETIHATSDVQTKAQIEDQETDEPAPPDTAAVESMKSAEVGAKPEVEEEVILELVEPLEQVKNVDEKPDFVEADPLDRDQPDPMKTAERTVKVEAPTALKIENTQKATPEEEQDNLPEQEIMLEAIAVPVASKLPPDRIEDQARTSLLKKQQAELAKAEALKKEKEAQARSVALKKQKLAKLEALKKQKVAQAKLEALKRQKAELAKAEALKRQQGATVRAETLRQQSEAQDTAEAFHGPGAAASAVGKPAESKAIESRLKIMGLLKKYEGRMIGINYDNSAEIREAELVVANDEFFSVRVKDKKLQYSYPLQTLLSLAEGEDGVETGDDEKKAKFTAVIRVYPLARF